MSYKIGALALAGLVALSTSARADEVAPAGKASTPKQCAESIIDAAKKSEWERMGSYMLEPGKTALPKMMPALMASQEGDAALAKALDAKFGKGAAAEVTGMKMGPRMAPVIDGSFEIVDVKEEGESATVKTRRVREGEKPEEKTIPMKKVEGFWFADQPVGPAKRAAGPMTEQETKQMELMVGIFGKQGEAMKGFAADVDSGKVATKEDAKKRYAEIQQQTLGAMMGGMGGPSGGGGRRGPKPPPKPEGGDEGGDGMGGDKK